MRFFFLFFPYFAQSIIINTFTPRDIIAVWDTTNVAGIANGTGAWNSNSSLFTYNGGVNNSPFCQSCNVAFGGGATTGAAGTVTLTGTQRINSLLFDTTVGGNYTLTGGTITCSNSNGCPFTVNQSGTISSVLSGANAIIKNGSQTLTLSGANTYSGGTTISSGTLQTSTVSGAGTGAITLGDANTGASNVSWLFLPGASPTNNVVVSDQGTGVATIGTYAGAAINTQPNGTLTLNRATTLTDGTGDRTSFFGKISGNVGTISIAGSRITFANAGNDFVGNLSVADGSIYQSDSSTALPNTTDITLNGASSFRLNGGGTHAIDALSGSASTSAVNIIAGGNATLSLGNNNGSATFNGLISDGAFVLSLIKNGTGTQTLGGANTFTGSTTVKGGILFFSNANSSVGTTSGITISDGGQVTLSSGVEGTNYTRPWFFQNTGGSIYMTQPNVAKNFTISGAITLNGPGSFSGNKAQTTTISGTISGGGSLTFNTVAGYSNNFNITGNNTFTGGTIINANAVVLCGNANAFGTGSVTINNGGTLTKNGCLMTNAIINNIGGTLNP